ncbi:MAG: GNAT family N-acetyltransferase, partial [Phycisphaerales bacterium]
AEPHAAPQLKPARFGEPAASPPPGPPSRRPIGSAPARRGDACNLRPLAPADRAIARAALAAPGIRAAALPWPGLPPAGHIDEIAEAYRRADEGLLIAIDDARGAHVGLAALRIDRAHERADFACLAAPGNPDPTHHAAPPLIDIAFQDLGLKRLTASATSPDAARTLEAVGFRHEATLKSHARIDGEYRDVRAFGLLREESAAIPQQS